MAITPIRRGRSRRVSLIAESLSIIATMVRSLSLVIITALGTSCATTHYVGSTKYPPTDPTKVETLFQEPTRPFEVIAFVEAKTVTIFDKPEGLMKQCREQAAKAGADAVIFGSTGKWSGEMDPKIKTTA